MNRILATLILPALLAATGCVSLSERREEALAPQPAQKVDVARLYTGRWYEIARTPQKITDGCVAGTTDYTQKDGQIIDKDACRMGTPDGKEKSFSGPVTLLNSEANKMRVNYRLFGFLDVPRTYWVLDHDETYGWFVVSDPNFQNISLFSRNARPSASETAMLTAKVKALGYDVTKLEYPAQFTAGQTPKA
jgi:apolipoprotein D and lipocalin family protein